jgi:hypothetical protein
MGVDMMGGCEGSMGWDYEGTMGQMCHPAANGVAAGWSLEQMWW